jgi:hypothetical protein
MLGPQLKNSGHKNNTSGHILIEDGHLFYHLVTYLIIF